MEKQELIRYLTQAYTLESKAYEQRALISMLTQRKRIAEYRPSKSEDLNREENALYQRLIIDEADKYTSDSIIAERKKINSELQELKDHPIQRPYTVEDPSIRVRTPFYVALVICWILAIISFIDVIINPYKLSGTIVVIIITLLFAPIIALIFEDRRASNAFKALLAQAVAKADAARREQYERIRELEDQLSQLNKQEHKEYKQQIRQQQSRTLSFVKPALSKAEPVLATLEKTLVQLYDMNVLYPKYRSFIGVATILEYLQSGRCYELTGPNGAYNLFEAEMRSDQIITKLDTIERKLDRIIANQHSLYSAISETNKRLDKITTQLDKSLALQKATVANTAITAANTAITAACTAAIATNTEALKYIALVR